MGTLEPGSSSQGSLPVSCCIAEHMKSIGTAQSSSQIGKQGRGKGSVGFKRAEEEKEERVEERNGGNKNYERKTGRRKTLESVERKV